MTVLELSFYCLLLTLDSPCLTRRALALAQRCDGLEAQLSTSKDAVVIPRPHPLPLSL